MILIYASVIVIIFRAALFHFDPSLQIHLRHGRIAIAPPRLAGREKKSHHLAKLGFFSGRSFLKP